MEKGSNLNTKAKSFGAVFWGLLFDITEERGGGLNLFQRFGVVLWFFLGYLEVVFSCKFFLNLVEQKLPNGCPKRVGGGGIKTTFGHCPKVSNTSLLASLLTLLLLRGKSHSICRLFVLVFTYCGGACLNIHFIHPTYPFLI